MHVDSKTHVYLPPPPPHTHTHTDTLNVIVLSFPLRRWFKRTIICIYS